MWFRTELLMVFVAIFATQSTHSQDPLTHPDQQQHQSPLVRTKRMFAMCPPKFVKIGNECYFISKFKVNWLDAHFECKDRNSKLAEPMKYEDRQLRKNFMRDDIDRADIWIGGIYNWERNKWQWGYNGKDIKYQSFSQMEPGSSRDLRFHCAVLNPELKYRWSARSCVERHHFICQHRMPYVTEKNRIKVYEKWNQTFPNEFVNEVEVKVAGDSNHRKRDYYRIQNQRRRSSNHLSRDQDGGFSGNVQLGYNKAGGVMRSQKIGQKQKINNEVTNDLTPVEQPPARHDNSRRRRKQKFHKQANLPHDFEKGALTKNNVHMSGNDVMKPMVVEDAPDPMQELNNVPKLTMVPQERPIPRRRRPHGRRRTTTTTTTPPTTEESLIDETRRLEEVFDIEENMDKALRKLEDFTARPETPSTTIEYTTTTTTTTTEQPTTTSTTTTEEPTTTSSAPSSTTTEAYSLSSSLSVEEEKKARREELRKRLQKLSPEQQRRFFELRKLRKARKSSPNETSE